MGYTIFGSVSSLSNARMGSYDSIKQMITLATTRVGQQKRMKKAAAAATNNNKFTERIAKLMLFHLPFR